MSKVVLDTVVLAAIVDTRDKWHLNAIALDEALLTSKAEVFVMDIVVSETISTLMPRLYEQKRESQVHLVLDRLEGIAPPSRINWISSTIQKLFPEILELIRVHNGTLNFNDALLALICRENMIPYIASFDRDFDRISWLTRIDAPANVPHS